MTESDSSVMRIALLDKYMTVKSSHFVYGENAYAAEGACGNIEYLALRDIRNELSVGVALQAVEGNVACGDVAFKSSSCEVGIASLGFKKSVLYELILDSAAVTHLTFGSVSAVEAHEGIGDAIVVLALDILVVDIFGNGVVDIEKSYSVTGNADTYVFAESAVNVHLTGYRYSHSSETAVYIAGLKAEL